MVLCDLILYTWEDSLFTSKKPTHLATGTALAARVTPGALAPHPPQAATRVGKRPSWFGWLGVCG